MATGKTYTPEIPDEVLSSIYSKYSLSGDINKAKSEYLKVKGTSKESNFINNLNNSTTSSNTSGTSSVPVTQPTPTQQIQAPQPKQESATMRAIKKTASGFVEAGKDVAGMIMGGVDKTAEGVGGIATSAVKAPLVASNKILGTDIKIPEGNFFYPASGFDILSGKKSVSVQNGQQIVTTRNEKGEVVNKDTGNYLSANPLTGLTESALKTAGGVVQTYGGVSAPVATAVGMTAIKEGAKTDTGKKIISVTKDVTDQIGRDLGYDPASKEWKQKVENIGNVATIAPFLKIPKKGTLGDLSPISADKLSKGIDIAKQTDAFLTTPVKKVTTPVVNTFKNTETGKNIINKIDEFKAENLQEKINKINQKGGTEDLISSVFGSQEVNTIKNSLEPAIKEVLPELSTKKTATVSDLAKTIDTKRNTVYENVQKRIVENNKTVKDLGDTSSFKNLADESLSYLNANGLPTTQKLKAQAVAKTKELVGQLEAKFPGKTISKEAKNSKALEIFQKLQNDTIKQVDKLPIGSEQKAQVKRIIELRNKFENGTAQSSDASLLLKEFGDTAGNNLFKTGMTPKAESQNIDRLLSLRKDATELFYKSVPEDVRSEYMKYAQLSDASSLLAKRKTGSETLSSAETVMKELPKKEVSIPFTNINLKVPFTGGKITLGGLTESAKKAEAKIRSLKAPTK